MKIPHLTPYIPDWLDERPKLREFIYFGFKQAWACIFAGLLLTAILATGIWYPDWGLSRYDFLFLVAVSIQLLMLAFRLESWREGCVILLFHAMATAMELFKTSNAIGSWSYPDASIIRLGNVPLFAGFMYSAVGSYMARAWRIFDFQFKHFPPLWLAGSLALLAYLNFFTHHYIPDMRWPLIVVGALVFTRAEIHFTPKEFTIKMNLLLGFILVAAFIYLAENLATFARAWQYPNQEAGWKPVHFSKFTSWYLLMQLSFILVYALRQLESVFATRRSIS